MLHLHQLHCPAYERIYNSAALPKLLVACKWLLWNHFPGISATIHRVEGRGPLPRNILWYFTVARRAESQNGPRRRPSSYFDVYRGLMSGLLRYCIDPSEPLTDTCAKRGLENSASHLDEFDWVMRVPCWSTRARKKPVKDRLRNWNWNRAEDRQHRRMWGNRRIPVCRALTSRLFCIELRC